jgi:hypothetical protein
MANYGPVSSTVISSAAFGSVSLDPVNVYDGSTASGAIVGGDPLEIAGNGTVRRVTTANTRNFVGVAASDAANGEKVRLYAARPIFDGVAGGAITAGDQLVASNTAGRTVASLAVTNADVTGTPTETTIETAYNAAINQARAIIGVALTTASDNATVRWMLK